MGLDQYLYRKIDVENWGFYEHKYNVNLTKTSKNKTIEIPLKNPTYITEKIFTWRKANQIHNYFDLQIEEITNSNPIVLEFGDLMDLKDKIEFVLSYKPTSFKPTETFSQIEIDGCLDIAKENIPTISGFYFGSTDYDEYYYEELESTLNMLKSLEKEHIEFKEKYNIFPEYEYSANW